MAIKEKLTTIKEGRVADWIASMGQPGYAGGKGKDADNLRKYHPNKDDSVVSKPWTNAEKWGGGAAAVAAGFGALALAKKLRGKKKKAVKKAKA